MDVNNEQDGCVKAQQHNNVLAPSPEQNRTASAVHNLIFFFEDEKKISLGFALAHQNYRIYSNQVRDASNEILFRGPFFFSPATRSQICTKKKQVKNSIMKNHKTNKLNLSSNERF